MRTKLVEKLFPTIELAYKQNHPTHIKIPIAAIFDKKLFIVSSFHEKNLQMSEWARGQSNIWTSELSKWMKEGMSK